MINKKEYAAYLGIFAIFFAAFVIAGGYPAESAGYPRLICSIGMALMVVLTVKNVFRDGKIRKDAEKLQEVQKELEKDQLTAEKFKRIAIFMGMLLVYIFCINKLGYFVSTALYLMASMTVFNNHKFRWVIPAVSVVFVVVMYLAFDRFLHIMIPHGILY